MPISDKKNRAMNRILRNKFHAAPALRLHAKPETAAHAEYSLSAEIPKSYNDTYVRAIPKDPQNTFVYWEMPKKQAAGNGMEANGKMHTGNGEAAAIQNKVNGGGGKPKRGGAENNNPGNNYRQDNSGDNHQNDGNHGNNHHGQNHGQYYDFESNSWRNGEPAQQHNNDNRWSQPPVNENFQDNHQPYRGDSNGFGQNHQHERHDCHGYDGRQDNRQTYQHGENGQGRHHSHGHDGEQHYQHRQQYYSLDGNCRRYYPTEYRHTLTRFTPPDSIGCVYIETPGIIAGTTVLTAECSILLDICKSQVRHDVAIPLCLSSGVLYKKVTAAPPPHLSSGILYSNHSAVRLP